MAVKLNIVTSYNNSGSQKAIRELAKLETAANRAGNTGAASMYALSSKITAVSGVAMAAGASLTKHVTLPLAALGYASINAAVDFETAFAGVEKTVDGTAEQMDALETGIRDMSKTIPAAATEIAAVAEAAGQLGIETDNVLAFTRVMIDLGEATNLTATEAASSLAQFAAVTQMSQGDFDRLGSTIVDLGNNLATTEADIVSMGQRVAGAGKQVGMTEADIMGLSAALASVGIEAEAGGTAISKTLIEIESAVVTGSDSLEVWADTAGMSADEFVAAWEKDPAAALDTVVLGLADMESQGSSTLQQLEKLGITEIRQRDALLRLAGASGQLTDSLGIARNAWEVNNALMVEAQKRYDTTASQMEMFKNKLTDAGVSLGSALVPALMDALDAAQPLIESIGDMARNFDEMDEEQQRTIVNMIALTAAAGPALSIFGKLLVPIAKTAKGIGDLKLAMGAGAEAAPKWAQSVVNAGRNVNAVKLTGAIAAVALLVTAYKELEPAAKDAARETIAANEHVITSSEAVAAPISSMAYAWELARYAAAEYNDTGEQTVTVTDMLAHPISALFYGINLLTGATNESTDATDKLAAAYSDTAWATDGATYAVVNYKSALEDLQGLQAGAERSEIAYERAKLRVADAQNRVTETLNTYGQNSPEYQSATLDLRTAELDLADAEQEVADNAAEVNAKLAGFPRPNSTDMQDWVSYYKAIGDKAGYAAAKANAANTALRDGRGGGSNQIPVYGAGGYVTAPHLALVGDQPEYIINPKAANAEQLFSDLAAEMYGGGFSGSARAASGVSSHTVTIAPGAVQVSIRLVNGDRAGAIAAADAISDRLMTRLAMGVA